MSGNVSIVRQLLEKGVSIHYNDLKSAINQNRFDTLRIMIEYKADVTLRGTRGQTLLFEAVWARNSDERIWNLLLDNGVDIDARSDFGMTALITAVERGRPKLVKLLVEHGADPTITDNDGKRAVDYIENTTREAELKALLEEYEAKWIAEHGEAASRGQSDV